MTLIRISLIILLLATPCYAVSYVDDANCQAAWLMEVNQDPITDSSQNTNTGAAAGDPTHATADPPAGGFSTGYWIFDGVTDRFDVTNHASLDPGGDFSIVAWIYLTTYGDDSYGRIFDNLDKTGNDKGYSFYVNDTSIVDGMSLNTANNTGGSDVDSSDASCLSTGSWIHVAVVFDDSANDITFYADGVEVGTPANWITPAASGIDATIGDKNTNDQQFNGRIDELAFFDRELSITEVNDIMDNGLTGTPAATGNSQMILITQG